MIKVKWKGAVSVFLSAIMAMSLLAGCGSKNEGDQAAQASSQPAQTASQPAQTAEAGAKVSETPIKISMFLQDSADQAISPDLPIIKEITNRTNVSFDFIPGPATEDQFREKFNVTIASGSIPDVVISPYRDDMFKVSEQGIFEPLDESIDKNAPNLKKLMGENPEIIKQLRSNDGKNYFLPFLGAVKTFKVWMVREDWLQKLNLNKPVTLDDWYSMLKAFKEKDPNGNGKQDEIPYTTRNTKAGLLSFMEAYRISGFEANEQFFIEDNKVKYAYTDPRFKDAITYINKLYKEGLVDPEYTTNDTKVWLSRITNEVSGACQDTTARAYSLGGMIKAANPSSTASMAVVAPPKGPTGIQMTTSQMQPVRGFTAISANSKYKEEIVKLFDYFYGDEGSMLMNFGIEGQTYNMVDGKPQYTDAITKDSQGRSILSMLNVYGHREWAYKQDVGYEDALLDDQFVKYRNDMEQYIKPTIPALSFTSDERDVINSKYTEIQTYKDEMIDKFIMGKEPLTNLDNFMNKIKSMGIDDVLKVEQAAYDRYNK
ncbi:MAG TPA: extracellular solute-binding protein [Clostridia bacterium]|nr:extracellular solute-binding protein [Clostridia bacterium]